MAVGVPHDAEALERAGPHPGLLRELPAGRPLGRLVRPDLAARKLPEAAEEARLRPTLDQPATVVFEYHDRGPVVGPTRSPARGRDRPRVRQLPDRPAAERDRAGPAVRMPREADGLSQFHDRFRELPRAVRGDQSGEREFQTPSGPGRPGIAGLPGPPGRHAEPVGLERDGRRPEREARDGPGDVRADPGQRLQLRDRLGQLASALGDQPAGRGVEVPRPGVVARPLPGLEDGGRRRGGEVAHGREPGEEPLVERYHRRDPGLLEHHLGDPDPVRIAVAAPRERPPVAREPGDERRPERRVKRTGAGRRDPGRRASPRRRHEAHV